MLTEIRFQFGSTEVVKGCFDNYFKQNQPSKPKIVIIDNAPVHTGCVFTDNIDKWQAQGAFPYFIPPYSPELNLIEILWKKIKYSWLLFNSYESIQKLKNFLEKILITYGEKYQISFA